MIESGRPRFMSEINVVPLVDVVLVLLIIFMVTAPMLYRGLDINLPRTATNTIKPEQRVVVTVDASARLCGQGGADADRASAPSAFLASQQPRGIRVSSRRSGRSVWNRRTGYGRDQKGGD